jgi:hypothetical protein
LNTRFLSAQVVIDRGAFPTALSLELFVDNHFVTIIEARVTMPWSFAFVSNQHVRNWT